MILGHEDLYGKRENIYGGRKWQHVRKSTLIIHVAMFDTRKGQHTNLLTNTGAQAELWDKSDL